jgi:hypothetical protein
MGSWQVAVQVTRCDSIGLALPHARTTLHNTGGLPLYSDLGEKLESVDVLGSSRLPKAYFRRTDALIALPMANLLWGAHVHRISVWL